MADVATLLASLRKAVNTQPLDACSLDDLDEVVDMVEEQCRSGRPDRNAVSRLLSALAVNDEASALADAVARAMFASARP